MSGGQAFVVGVVLIVVYFLPTFIALARKHHNFGAIFALNLLAGWVVIGWFAAFIWSLTEVKSVAVSNKVSGNALDKDTKTCPKCAESVKSAALVCRYCGYNFEEDADNLKAGAN